MFPAVLRPGLAALPTAVALLVQGTYGQTFALTLLHLNDHHSHLAGERVELDGSLLGFSEDVKLNYGGYPRLVTGFSQLKSAAEDNGDAVLKLHAGDAITGTSYFSLFKGEADAELMARVCFDAFELGNHEFDDGDQTLSNFIGFLGNHSTLCNSTPVLAANVVPGATSPLVGKITSSTVITVGGESIGIVGINTRSKTMDASSPSHGTVLSDERSAAQAEIDQLSGSGVNKIVLLTHIGYDLDQSWMASLSGIDVVIGGDSHSLLGDANTTAFGWNAQGTYPTEMQNSDGNKVCVAQAWEYTKAIGNMRVTFDSSGDVVSCAGSPVFVYDGSSMIFDDDGDTALNASQLSAVNDYLASLGGQWQPMVEDADTVSAFTVYQDQVTSLQQEEIATVPADICFDRFPGQGRSSICSAEDTQSNGGGACQLVAMAFLSVTRTADIAIQNAGGCRTDIASGSFTHDDAYTMLPFSNTLVTLEMTGAQIVQVLEDALVFGLAANGSTGAYPYASGLRFAVDASASAGSRFSHVQVNPRLEVQWQDIDANAAYTVVTNSYIAGGKDGYSHFLQASAVTDTYTEYAEGLVMHAKDVGTFIEPPLSEWSTQAYTHSDGTVYSTWPGSESTTPTSASENADASGAVASHSFVGSAFLTLIVVVMKMCFVA